MASQHRNLISLAIDLPLILQRDNTHRYTDKAQRDRHIAQQFATQHNCQDLSQAEALDLLSFWHERHSHAQQAPHNAQSAASLPVEAGLNGASIQASVQLASVVCVLLAMLIGSTTASALFHFDGTSPINILWIMGIFVFAQLPLIIATLLMMKQPASSLQHKVSQWRLWLGSIDPGWAAAVLAQKLPSARATFKAQATDTDEARISLKQMLGWEPARQGALITTSHWLLLCLSQRCAFAFNASALVCALAYVMFSDLAFVWATSLSLDTQTMSTFLGAFALPWSWIVPAAGIDYELVAATQYFRWDGQTQEGGARLFTQWWPYLLMCMCVYAVLPRGLLWLYSERRLNQALHRLLLENAAVTALLDRMTAPVVMYTEDTTSAVASVAEQHATDKTSDEPGLADHYALPESIDHSSAASEGLREAIAVIWLNATSDNTDTPQANSDQPAPELAQIAAQMGIRLAAVLHAGSGSVTQEQAAVEAVVTTLNQSVGPKHVVVFAPAWEPPTLDLLDFLQSLESQHPFQSIIFVPMPATQSDITRIQLESWRTGVARFALPNAYVELPQNPLPQTPGDTGNSPGTAVIS